MFARKISKTGATPVESTRDIGGEVLRFLVGQALPATPGNYTLGHLILSNVEGLAARAADAVTMRGDRLSQIDADRILTAHGPRPETEETERADLRRQTLRLAELAAAAMASTSDFGRAIAEESAGLEGQVAAIVAMMIDRADEAERRLAEAAQEIDVLRQEVETAKGDAARDALTGLLNRRGVLTALAAMTEPAKARVTIAICDVDRFKAVNDRYGHVVGDRVLKLVAASLEENCRHHIVARWGGEEFLLVLKDTDLAAGTELVDAARRDLAQRNVKLRATDEPLGPITFSAGVTLLGTGTLDQAIRIADTRLYRAKAAGRNLVLADDEPPAV